jgi:hypothetical protein
MIKRLVLSIYFSRSLSLLFSLRDFGATSVISG